MDDNNFRKLIQIVEDNSEIKKEGGLSEGTGEVVKKVFKHKGKPVGEVGVDLASSPGGGMYYMKYYGSGRAVSGYDSMEEAFAELKHYLNQMKEGAIGDSSPYQEGYNAWKDYLAGKTKQRPVNPYPAGKGMGEWENGAADAAEHIDWGEGPLG